MSCPAPAPPQPSRGPGELGRLRPCPAPVPQEEPGTACLPEEGHPQLQGWDGSWIWVQLVTFLGCSFSFPARSAQRWRRWQLHGSAVPVAAVRPRPDAGEAAAAPPARGQRLLPGTEAPLRALPGVSWQRLTPHTALTAPAHSGTGAGRVIALAALVPVAPWGARGGPVAVPACPFPLQPKRPRCHQCSCASSCPVSPRGPSRALGVQLELGGQRGPLHPRAVLQGKPCFPSKGCNPGPTGLAGVRAPGCPWGGGWVPPRLPEQLFLGRAAIPPRTGPVGAVSLLSPLSLCRAGLPQAWLWMDLVWGVQPFSVQPQELLYCWGEAGPAAPSCPACHSLRSLDSMIVRLCAPSLTL